VTRAAAVPQARAWPVPVAPPSVAIETPREDEGKMVYTYAQGAKKVHVAYTPQEPELARHVRHAYAAAA
jgi:hypothetical protein